MIQFMLILKQEVQGMQVMQLLQVMQVMQVIQNVPLRGHPKTCRGRIP